MIGQIKECQNIKKVISKDIITEYKIKFKPNYILMLVIAVIYVSLLYTYGIKKPTLIANLDLVKYMNNISNVGISICNRLQASNNT